VEILVKHIKISKTWGEDTDIGGIRTGIGSFIGNIWKLTLSLIDFISFPILAGCVVDPAGPVQFHPASGLPLRRI
jgi:hypothetical protein